MKSIPFYLILLVAILAYSSCDRDANPIAVDTLNDWEGGNYVFNEPYRDSIVFCSERFLETAFAPSIYIMNRDGSGIRSLSDRWFTYAPSWSPNKWKIFYVADTSFGLSARALFLMNANGTNKQRLTPMSENVWGVDCAPDGKKIAYIVLNASGYAKIKVAKPDGSESHDITGFFGSSQVHTLSWSPDSKWIAFDGHDAGNEFKENGIGLANEDGRYFGTLFTHDDQCYDPDWSPDGTKLAFICFTNTGKGYTPNVFYFDNVAKRIHQVTFDYTIDGRPHWSRDGKYIVYQSQLPGNAPAHIFITDLEGNSVRQITDGSRGDWNPSW